MLISIAETVKSSLLEMIVDRQSCAYANMMAISQNHECELGIREFADSILKLKSKNLNQ